MRTYPADKKDAEYHADTSAWYFSGGKQDCFVVASIKNHMMAGSGTLNENEAPPGHIEFKCAGAEMSNRLSLNSRQGAKISGSAAVITVSGDLLAKAEGEIGELFERRGKEVCEK